MAANQDSVQLRFAYRQQFDEPAAHYFWGIDDVVVTSYPEENDLEITRVTNGDITTLWEYRITPMEQAIGAVDDSWLPESFTKMSARKPKPM